MKIIKDSRGVTLIELMVTLALLSIVVGIAVPKIDRSNYLLKTQAQQLCADIRDVKVLRMSEGQDYKITLNSNYYSFKKGIQLIKKVNLLQDFELDYTFAEVKFNYNSGAPHGGDTITIKNVRTRKAMEITIVPSSGRVLLKDEILTY